MSVDPPKHNDDLRDARRQMIGLLQRYGISDRVIDAIATVPRERFVAAELQVNAYDERPLPIGHEQTISQPFIVAMMTDVLAPGPDDRVLEVGTGSGYQSAVLSRLARSIVTVERVDGLRESAAKAIRLLGYENISLHAADATLGRREDAPYDAIIVTAAAPHVPRSLIDQLSARGRLVIPVGTLQAQELLRVEKTPFGVTLARRGPCVFVPLIADEAWSEREVAAASRRIKV